MEVIATKQEDACAQVFKSKLCIDARYICVEILKRKKKKDF